ncbi:MAG: glycosyltransferase family 4 protein [Thermoplasmata archaeon]|nr:glycosyltransferase family 4 protein [Thermoplasmata archaeon]
MPKIVMFVSNPYLPDPRVEKEARTLADAGHDILIIARNSRPEFPENEIASYCKIRRVTIPIPEKITMYSFLRYYIKYMKLSRKMSREFEPDIVHCHDLYTLPIGIGLGKPLIYDSHENYSGLHFPKGGVKARLTDAAERLLVRFSDAVITVSEDLGQKYPRKKVAVVMNCPMHFKILASDSNTIREKYGIPRDAFVAVYQGGLTAHRSLEMIVSNFASRGAEMIPGFKILVCGKGNIEPELRKRAASNVIFTGHLPSEQLFSIMAASDIGLILFEDSPNNRVGLPNKLFEYMAIGIPVLASNLPTMARVIGAEKIGITIDPEDSLKVFDALKLLHADVSGRERMGDYGVRAFKERYNWEIESKKLLAVYERLI